jgi:Zn-dependent protease with chaperone function
MKRIFLSIVTNLAVPALLSTRETGGFMRLFMSHPGLEARIAALRSPNA